MNKTADPQFVILTPNKYYLSIFCFQEFSMLGNGEKILEMLCSYIIFVCTPQA